MKLIKTKLALATLLALAGQGVANADSIGSSQLNITNFQWLNSGGAQITNIVSIDPHFNLNSTSTNNAQILASFEGGSSSRTITSQVTGPTGGAIADATRCSGPDCTSSTSGTFAGGVGSVVAPTGSYAIGENSLNGALVAIDLNTNGVIDAGDITGGVDAKNWVQASLTSNATTVSANAVNGTTSSFFFKYTGAASMVTTLSLDYVLDVFASVIAPMGTSDTAYAQSTWNLTLDNIDATTGAVISTVLSWTPGQLQALLSVGAGEFDKFKFGTGNLTNTATLLADADYRLTIGHTNYAFVTRNVPEPGVMALLGIGLLGFGLQKRKNDGLII